MRTLKLSLVVALTVGLYPGCAEDEGDQPSQEVIDGQNAAAEEIAAGKADEAGCSGTVLPDRRGFAHRIALTFDDGPNLVTTPKVLDILAAHGVQATFFMNGKNVTTAAHRDLVKRMAAAGHLIGNHSQNHLNLKTVSAATLRSEVEKTRDILAGLDVTLGFFRFPFGSASCTSAATVRDYGYHVTGWHIDSADWCYGAGGGYCSPATFRYVADQYRRDINGYVVSQAKATGGGVLLFHDVHAWTVAHLDAVLTSLEDAGFTFVRLDDTTTFPKLNGVAAPPPGPWVGTPCGTDADCSFTASGAAAFCYRFGADGGSLNYGFCSVACAGFCPDRAGAAATFCVAAADGTSGLCAAKAGADACGATPGTSAQTADRYIGSSTATPATASVCLPR
ncbi:MAG TPA: polysaccharide deacetylase family protein [Polyangia bacterium]